MPLPPVDSKEDIRTQRKSLANLYDELNPRAADRILRKSLGKVEEIREPEPQDHQPPEHRESKAHLEFLENREKWRKSKGGQQKRRTVSVDLGLMSAADLAQANAAPGTPAGSENGRVRSNLEQLLAEHHQNHPYKICPTADEAKEQTRWFLDHASIKISYDDVMMIITLFVLFGPDFRLLFFSAGADDTFEFLNALSFFLFLVELLLNSWAKTEFFETVKNVRKFKPRGYFLSFFFFLDLIALWSIIFEVEWLKEGTGMTFMDGSNGSQSNVSFRAGRVVRMIRLVRLVKLYKITSQRRREKKMLEDLKVLVEQGRMGAHEIEGHFHKMQHQKQSKVGTDLVDMITRKVIICVLSMLILVPLCTLEQETLHFDKTATLFHNTLNRDFQSNNCEALTTTVKDFLDITTLIGVPANEDDTVDSPYYVLGISFSPDPGCSDTDTYLASTLTEDFSEERPEYLKEVVLNSLSGNVTTITFSQKDAAQDGAYFSILLTCFVIIILISMSIAFENDAQQLVLSPIEQMMEMINMVADDPLEEFDFDNLGGTAGEYELKVVSLAIQKITTLLRIGFGVAGAEIISKNMSTHDDASSGLDPMIPGKRMYAIFGFCDIHEFDMCTEVLEDEIMTFVNNVARIVHEQVTRWSGTCNKNLGNAFLMIWRIGDEDELVDGNTRKRLTSSASGGGGEDEKTGHINVDLKRLPGLDTLSDKALFGFLKVVVEINRDPAVLGYRSDKRLQHGGQPFKLRMGFGLHAGWAIEGAVGSLQKVDATYLSPHVNMSARMEAASRQFGVAILMTERFHELMSKPAQDACRRLDVVTVKGSAVPMPIYTYDTFQNQTFPELMAPKGTGLSLVTVLKKQAENYTVEEWNKDQDLQQLRILATAEFNKKFKEGIDTYLLGNWSKAREILEECDVMMKDNDHGGDGPSRTILNYMKNRAWICPTDWEGFRPLTSK
mmetsp:Transcript_18206/g.33850  ORF Transcript_18206/g.33850 Transcript_18206/m.33850 type:complete len:952 (+) Transcript_18206:62-2917(+)